MEIPRQGCRNPEEGYDVQSVRNVAQQVICCQKLFAEIFALKLVS